MRRSSRRPLWLAGAAWLTVCLFGAVGVARLWPVSVTWVTMIASWAGLAGCLVLLLGFGWSTRRRHQQRWQALGDRVVRLTDELGGAERPSTRWGVSLDDVEAAVASLESALEDRPTLPQLTRLIEWLPLPALLLRDDRVVMANAPLERLVGRSRQALKAGSVSDLPLVPDVVSLPERVSLSDTEGRRHPCRVVWTQRDDWQLGVFVDDTAHDQALRQLTQERDRAREESALKTRYLGQVRRELQALEREAGGSPSASGAERLGGLLSLLERLGDPESRRDEATSGGRRVLIVDDGPVNAALAQRVLAARGLHVDVARSGEEALACLFEHDYSLVFMDIFMPSLDGIETSRRWREHEQRAQQAGRSILIALTANASEADRERFFAAGMDDYLAKPYRPQALIDMVGRWLPDAMDENAVTS
ncbi:response regulator [Modicisalibacter coralii]|uniref:response regulator n=1 Tax=Modicisalibacter coralii TaxID=2304602 RepID=UPI001396B64B|nr:response regulator [Halomonas coralii]